ncbi:MAG: hypothetical protein ACOC00_04260 [Halothiobacillaceae bacterium]
MKFLSARLPVLMFLSLFALGAQAQTVKVGDPLPALEFEDQNDQARDFPGEARLIFFAADKAAGEMSSEALESMSADQVEAARLVYLMDISPMPSLVTRMFVMPGLRERPYPILLAREDGQTDFLPTEEKQVTVIRLDDSRRIESIEYVDDPDALQEMVAQDGDS